MIERAALHLNFFWGGVCNSSNVLYPQCSILPRLVASRCHQNCSFPPNSLHKLPIMACKWKKICSTSSHAWLFGACFASPICTGSHRCRTHISVQWRDDTWKIAPDDHERKRGLKNLHICAGTFGTLDIGRSRNHEIPCLSYPEKYEI